MIALSLRRVGSASLAGAGIHPGDRELTSKEIAEALAGFGKFSVSRRAARPGRNPRSGETIVIGPSTRVGFRAAKALKDRLAKR